MHMEEAHNTIPEHSPEPMPSMIPIPAPRAGKRTLNNSELPNPKKRTKFYHQDDDKHEINKEITVRPR